MIPFEQFVCLLVINKFELNNHTFEEVKVELWKYFRTVCSLNSARKPDLHA